ncbi:MAG: hypothetical protein ACOY82_10105 [Pseudomonadota bacterium]
MKTIRLYHPHTHEGIAYDPPPEGIELSVNDADAAVLEAWGLTTPPPALADADAPTASDADAPVSVADGAGNDATAAEATPPHIHVANATDRRARVAVDLSSTEPTADTTARSA